MSHNDPIKTYFIRCAAALTETDTAPLLEIADAIVHRKRAGVIFTAGNGGSASTASHFCNDLIKGCRVDGRAGFNARCLNDALSVVTCLANDFSYADIFSVQLETCAKKGDLLLLFSGSGNSPNILAAAEKARAMGLTVAGLTGRDGGALRPLCDICITAPIWGMEEIEDLHLAYCHALVSCIRKRLKLRWDIEIVRYPSARCRYALFDFDGTVSLLREGWQQVMIPYFCEVLAAADASADRMEVEQTVTEFVSVLTGKQTIFQCERLAEEVTARGGQPLDAYAYKKEYLRRLMARIAGRLAALRSGQADPDAFLVPGSKEFLKKLRARGVRLYLASGTDEADVLEEARLLGVDGFFDGGIYGALDTVKDCSKELVIQKILTENKIEGDLLAAFGDGYVEIELVRAAGGYAMAVATDEEKRAGVNAWKREKLLKAGADAVVPDFADYEFLDAFV